MCRVNCRLGGVRGRMRRCNRVGVGGGVVVSEGFVVVVGWSTSISDRNRRCKYGGGHEWCGVNAASNRASRQI